MNQTGLQDIALRYVSRYATTRHKLKAYLHRKLREREWDEEQPADVDGLVAKLAGLGYIDDALFAKNKAAALSSRGYGKRRISQALYQAGIAEGDDADAMAEGESRKWEAARTFARKRSIGPYAAEMRDSDTRRKQLQAFLRAGHGFDIAARFVNAAPGEAVEDGD